MATQQEAVTGSVTYLDLTGTQFDDSINVISIPSDAFEYNGHSYRIYSTLNMTWEEAKEFCESLGGHLVTITDPAEKLEVEFLLDRDGVKNNYWLGGYKDSGNNWQWVTGEDWNYTNWASGEPNNSNGNENALMMFYRPYNASTPFGTWNDLNSSGTLNSDDFYGTGNFGLICEWDAVRAKKTQQDVIKDFMHSLDETELGGEAALDEAVSYASNGKFSNCQSLIENFILDCQSYDSDTFLRKYCSINLDNEDTGAITGWDAGGINIKTAESIIYEEGDAVFPSSFVFEKEGLTLSLFEEDNWSTVATELKGTSERIIFSNLYTWWLEESLKLIDESYGIGFNSYGVTTKNIGLYFFSENSNVLAATLWPEESSEIVSELWLKVNLSHYSFIKSSDKNGTSYDGKFYLDRTLAHELTHAAMASNVKYFTDKMPLFIADGLAELVHGIDDERKDTISALVNNPNTISQWLNLNLNSSTVKDMKELYTKEVYAAGYLLLRYLAKQASNMPDGVHCDSDKTTVILTEEFKKSYFDVREYFPTITKIYNYASGITIIYDKESTEVFNYGARVTFEFIGDNNSGGNEPINRITGSEENDTLNSSEDNVIIDSGEGKDKISYTGKGATIYSGDGDDSISNGGSSVTINGGAGNDYISNDGDGSNVTISGGEGDDSISNSGSSVEINGGAGNDSISNNRYGANVTIDGGAGGDYIRNYSSNVTISGGEGDDSISNSGSSVEINGGAGNDSISNSGLSVTIDGGAGNDSIFNDSGDSVKIFGGAGDDYIYNYDGSSVTIDGGAGNDKIRLNFVENNLIIYNSGDGNDTLYGLDYDATLKIIGAEYSTLPVGSDLIINVGNDSVLVINGNVKPFYINDILTSISKNILGTSNADSIYNPNSDATINAGAGNDSIDNWGTNVTIDAGAGDDSIFNWGDSVTIDGGVGDDLISLRSYNHHHTITGGKGNDTVFFSNNNSGNVYIYNSGDGNDSILGISDTISVGGGTYTTQVSSSDLIIKVGAEAMTLVGSANTGVKIFGALCTSGAGNDSIYNNGDSLMIISDDGDDYISNIGSSVTIEAGAGNDSIYNNRYGLNVTIDGGDGDDSISNSGLSVTIDGGDGDDYISNSGSSVKINGGAGNDYISNGYYTRFDGKQYLVKGGANVIIEGGTGNDSIENYNGDSVTIDGGDGDDYISNSGSSVTINGGSGNDSIYNNDASNVTIDGGDGDDFISNNGSSVSIDAGAGNDYISNSYYGSNVTIDGGDGDDSISNGGSSVTINGGAGNDYISNSKYSDNYTYSNTHGSNVTIDGGDGDDSISNSGLSVTIDGGDGDDYISNSGSSVTINGGSGNDSIGNYGSNVMIGGSAGDDSIYNGGSSVTIDGGDGDDSISNSGLSVTIDGGDGDDYISNSGSSVTINGGSGNDSIGNYGSNVMIDGSAGDDSVSNGGSRVTIDSGGGNDIISNSGNSVIVDSGDGNDSISNYYCESVTIDGGSGNDSIYIGHHSYNVTIDGGSGADLISLDSDIYLKYNTIFGGKDNDTIYLNPYAMMAVYVYNFDDGNDEIYYATEYSTISIGGGTYTTQTSGADLIIKVGSDAITLVGAASAAVNIIGTLGTGNDEEPATIGATINNTVSGVTLKGTTNKDSIMNYGGDEALITADADADTIFSYGDSVTIEAGAGDDIIDDAGINSVIDGGAGNDRISLTGGGISSVITVIGGQGDDTIYGDMSAHIYQYNPGDGNDTIFGFNSDDTLYVSTDSIGDASISGEDVVLKIGSGTVNLKAAKAQPIKLKNSSGTVIETILGGDEEETLPPDTDTLPAGISISGATLTASTAFTGNSISLADFDSAVTKVNASALSRSISIVGTAADNSLKGGKGADTIFGEAGNDTVSLGGGADVYIYDSGNDLIQDYTAGADKIKLASATITSASVSGSNVVLKTSAGNITVKGGKDKAITVIDASGSETTKIYPESSSDSLPAGISVSGATLTASTAFTGNKIDLADYASTVTKVNAAALTRGVTIVGSAAANSVKGGKGADTISGGAGNDTVSLGGGADVYVYTSGNDLIQDYTAGTDKIKLPSASITGSSLSGSNVVLKTSAGNITVKNGKGNNITIVDAAGKETTQIYPSVTPEPTPSSDLTYDTKKTAVTLASSFNGTLKATDYASTVKKIDASKVSKSINIAGNAQANTIIGGSKAETIYGGTGNDSINGNAGNDKLYGEAGADTLYGGTGADTLTGGDGKDVFVYVNGDGADVIADFTAGQDSIKLTSGTISSASLKGSDMIFKIGSGSLTVKNGKGKELSVGSSIYFNNLVYDTKKTSVTLASGFTGSLRSADYASTVKKIDASAVSKSVNLVGNAQANTIIGSSKAETIYGGTGNDSILGGAGNDKLYGEAGADTLYGGAGADTLTGGDGKDVFVYANGDGADVIADFTVGQDSIKLTSGTVASASLKGSDMVLKIGSGSLTVKNGKGKEISVGSSIYFNNLVYDAKKTAVTLASSFTGSLKASDYASTVKKIDASAISKSVNLIGNAQANTIICGSKAETIYGGTGNDSIKGGAGNDKLYGEAGNDTLWGGAGNDIFVYGSGEGKDVIADYAAGDTIKISSGTITATGYKSNDVIFTVGSGTLTVKNGKGKAITITDASNKTSTKTYATGVVYGSNATSIRNSNALWFTDDDNNFATGTAGLPSKFVDDDSECSIGDLSIGFEDLNFLKPDAFNADFSCTLIESEEIYDTITEL